MKFIRAIPLLLLLFLFGCSDPNQATMPAEKIAQRVGDMVPGEVGYLYAGSLTVDYAGKIWLWERYRVEDDPGVGSVTVRRNSDGTFTVTCPAECYEDHKWTRDSGLVFRDSHFKVRNFYVE